MKLSTQRQEEVETVVPRIVVEENGYEGLILLLRSFVVAEGYTGLWKVYHATCLRLARRYMTPLGHLAIFLWDLYNKAIRNFWFSLDSPNGACWNENATTFLEHSKVFDNESRGKPSAMTTLIRPRSSPAFQKVWARISRRNAGNFKVSTSPCLLTSGRQWGLANFTTSYPNGFLTDPSLYFQRPISISSEHLASVIINIKNIKQ